MNVGIHYRELFKALGSEGHQQGLPIIKMPVGRRGRYPRLPSQGPEGKALRPLKGNMRLRRAQQRRA